VQKLLTNLIMAHCAAFTMGTAVHAQSLQMNVNVPFGFEVRDLLKQAPNTASKRIFTIQAGSSVDPGARPARLLVHRYGYRCFLAEVWMPGKPGIRIPRSRAEKELIRSGEKMRAAILVLNPRPGVEQGSIEVSSP
jgi:hypothetical protein